MNKDLAHEQNEFFSAIEEKTNIDDMQVLLGNLYWQRKAAEAIASQKIAEAELEKAMLVINDTISQGDSFALSDNAKQALNNQTIYSYLKAVDKRLGNTDAYFAKQVFSGDDR